MNQKITLQFHNVTFGYDKPLLEQFQFSFEKEGIYSLLGKSGCGKTTFLKLISGLLLPQSGSVIHSAKKISFLFQENRLLPWLTVLDNLLIVTKDRQYCLFLLKELELLGTENKMPSALSGGMLRRVALARALAYDGDIFLLDEPFTGIDTERKQHIMLLLQKKMTHKICIFVTHHIQEALSVSSHIYTLEKSTLKPVSPSFFVEESC